MASAHGHHPLSHDFPFRKSWLLTGSRWRLRLIAATIGVVVFVVVAAADWLMINGGVSHFGIMMGSDAVAAVLASWFALKLFNDVYERRQMLMRRLDIIGETNHHIRNALELIQLSAQTTHDQEVIQNISTGVDRIQWVLRELIGEGDGELGNGHGPKL